MSVRAKFRLNSYTTQMNHPWRDGKQQPAEEMRTLNFTPVTSGSAENASFFGATPSGSLQLGVVNKAAWEMFELDKEYYLDFTLAE
jgi:hypothetical protein